MSFKKQSSPFFKECPTTIGDLYTADTITVFGGYEGLLVTPYQKLYTRIKDNPSVLKGMCFYSNFLLTSSLAMLRRNTLGEIARSYCEVLSFTSYKREVKGIHYYSVIFGNIDVSPVEMVYKLALDRRRYDKFIETGKYPEA